MKDERMKRRKAAAPEIAQLKTGVLWAVIFRDHIHTDAEQKLAVFATRTKATQWIKEHGGPDCRVLRLNVETAR
jgi:hypothetical protein